jgi:ankyrin repeat protein
MSTTPTQEEINQYIIDCHSDLDLVKQKTKEQPLLVHGYNPAEDESALGAAGHMGRRDIAEFLLAQGAELELATAAMLGLREEVKNRLAADPGLATSGGAHGIPVAFHAAMSGDIGTMQLLWDHGAQDHVRDSLIGAVWKNRPEMVAWLVDHQADLKVVDFRNKTALEVAQENGFEEIIALLIAADQ